MGMLYALVVLGFHTYLGRLILPITFWVFKCIKGLVYTRVIGDFIFCLLYFFLLLGLYTYFRVNSLILRFFNFSECVSYYFFDW